MRTAQHSQPREKQVHGRAIPHPWCTLGALCISVLLGASAYAVSTDDIIFADSMESPTEPHVNFNLNDTGITWSGHATDSDASTCDPAHPSGQDCHHGRDALAAAGQLSKVGGGNAGFDFTKISNSGHPLPADAMLGSASNDWACTRDNVTGLIWEVKTTSGLRGQDHTYTWYDPASPDGNPGAVGDVSSCGNTLDDEPCNTHSYVLAVNDHGLCGANDWRMPTWQELQGIVDYGHTRPAIDAGYFPNTTQNAWFRSGSITPYGTTGALVVDVAYGRVYDTYRSTGGRVRLVRAGQ